MCFTVQLIPQLPAIYPSNFREKLLTGQCKILSSKETLNTGPGESVPLKHSSASSPTDQSSRTIDRQGRATYVMLFKSVTSSRYPRLLLKTRSTPCSPSNHVNILGLHIVLVLSQVLLHVVPQSPRFPKARQIINSTFSTIVQFFARPLANGGPNQQHDATLLYNPRRHIPTETRLGCLTQRAT